MKHQEKGWWWDLCRTSAVWTETLSRESVVRKKHILVHNGDWNVGTKLLSESQVGQQGGSWVKNLTALGCNLFHGINLIWETENGESSQLRGKAEWGLTCTGWSDTIITCFMAWLRVILWLLRLHGIPLLRAWAVAVLSATVKYRCWRPD